MPECKCATHIYIMAILVKHTFSDIIFYYACTSNLQNQKVEVWVKGHFVTQFQGQILCAAANNGVCGHVIGVGLCP